MQSDYSPIHWDDAVARGAGAGDRPIAQGTMILELVTRAAGQLVDGLADYREMQVRFRRPVLAGDRLTIEVEATEVAGTWSITARNQEGVVAVEATAVTARDG